MKLFDAHCHLQLPQYDEDREAVIARMREAAMGAVVIGTDYETSRAALELAASHDFLWASVGLHPNDNKDEVFDTDKYEALARDPKIVAIGECGLDYFRSGGTEEKKAAQIVRFEQHIALAQKVGKPLVIHCRDSQQRIANSNSAHKDMLGILAECKPAVLVIIHFFTGSGELAQRYLDLGCYLSFPGPVTYTDTYDDSIRLCPLERMLVETDAPFAAPVPYRGKRNEPLYVEHIIAKIAVLKNISVGALSRQIVLNSQHIFSIPTPESRPLP